MHDVLARAARQLEDEPARRQVTREHSEDGVAVALCRRCVAAMIGHGDTVASSPPNRQPYPHAPVAVLSLTGTATRRKNSERYPPDQDGTGRRGRDRPGTRGPGGRLSASRHTEIPPGQSRALRC